MDKYTDEQAKEIADIAGSLVSFYLSVKNIDNLTYYSDLQKEIKNVREVVPGNIRNRFGRATDEELCRLERECNEYLNPGEQR